MSKSKVNVREFVYKTAKYKGWEVLGEGEFLDSLIEGLESNLERLGYLQCPCRLSWDDREKDRDIICPCVYAQEDIDQWGHCFCSLFLSSEFALKGEEPSSIPERRDESLFP